MPVRAGRKHRRHHRGDQVVIDPREPRLPIQTGSLRGDDVPAGYLTIHPRPLGDRPQPGPLEPAAENCLSSTILTSLNPTLVNLCTGDTDTVIQRADPGPTDTTRRVVP